jgi:SAM-dependent methyltransferase
MSGFGSRELYGGSRFLVPLSEEALLEAGRAAGFHEGATLLELGAGNGCAAVFLAEAFHLYVRGVEGDPELLGLARENGARSPARQRLRFLAGDDVPRGPFDYVAALRGPVATAGLARPGGRLLLGRFLAPPELLPVFPPVRDPPGDVAWRREATPLEWERFLRPLERSLKEHREGLAAGASAAPLALDVDRQISLFRAHAAALRYELLVAVAP